eukprot:jgi/Tetstr1/449884/TSEL_036943.t1
MWPAGRFSSGLRALRPAAAPRDRPLRLAVSGGDSPAVATKQGRRGGGRGGGRGGRPADDRAALFESMPSARSGGRGDKGRGVGRGGRGRGRGRGGRHSSGAPGETSDSIPILRQVDMHDRTAATTDFYSDKSWKAAGAAPPVVEAVKQVGFARPSHVQAESYSELLSGSAHAIVADRAGSGKTLAYLLPFVQALRDMEASAGEPFARKPKEPRLVIVAPTEELVQQVRRVAQALGKAGLPLGVTAITGGHKYRAQRERLAEGTDVVVATPGRLMQHLRDGNLSLASAVAIVVDEVDVLLAEGSEFRQDVVDLRKLAGPRGRFVMATATLPHSVYLDLLEEFDGLEIFQGPGLHRNPPGVTEQLIDCSGGDEVSEESGFARKFEATVRVLRSNAVSRSIVFCNKIETCRKIENGLKRLPPARGEQQQQELQVLPYHAAISDTSREKHITEFLRAPDDSEVQKVLVCTDRASRGVDSTYVEHVVLFDFPRDPSEYVRRVGRTARGAGGQGLVTSLVLGRQVGLAANIIKRNQRGVPLHKVPNL